MIIYITILVLFFFPIIGAFGHVYMVGTKHNSIDYYTIKYAIYSKGDFRVQAKFEWGERIQMKTLKFCNSNLNNAKGQRYGGFNKDGKNSCDAGLFLESQGYLKRNQ
ncbi:hypothetical protein ACJOV8_017055 [Formosa sp. 3Alg 14/1]|uniref:hypothetical protein n=1 Tax=Formosa sp. 3Alg 14/1 TaxID=3382190 RepID=UPI0039BDEE76